MKNFEESPNHVDMASIDRLVDGDLSDSDRRALLLRLENDPEGWRRCALAFLEDQVWRKALGAEPLVQSSPSHSPSLAIPATVLSRASRFRRLSAAAALLASTFAMGLAAGEIFRSSPRTEIAQANRPETVAPSTDPRADEIREVGSIQVVDGSAGESAPRQFPILSGPGLDDQWLRDQPPSVPDYLRARWERRGYQVEEHRLLMSVDLKDGRRVSIPVDEVELDYVGQQPL